MKRRLVRRRLFYWQYTALLMKTAENLFKKGLTFYQLSDIINNVVTIYSKYGLVVQLVRTPACHAGGRRFEPVLGRHFAAMAQQAEHVLGKDEVTGSNPVSSSRKYPVDSVPRGFLFVFIT